MFAMKVKTLDEISREFGERFKISIYNVKERFYAQKCLRCGLDAPYPILRAYRRDGFVIYYCEDCREHLTREKIKKRQKRMRNKRKKKK